MWRYVMRYEEMHWKPRLSMPASHFTHSLLGSGRLIRQRHVQAE